MEVEQIIYKAKDGRLFTDPLACEEYEKKLGIIPGTIGELVSILEKERNQEHQVSIMIMYFDKEKGVQLLPYISFQISDDEDDPLSFEKDKIAKVGSVVKALKKLPQDAPAQWMGWTIESFNAETCSLCCNCNLELFKIANQDTKK